MHATSMENMQKCFNRYYSDSVIAKKPNVKVVDIGAANFNGSYRSIFNASNIEFIGVDLEDGPGVDVILDSPYALPFENESIDLVISGQAFEHCEFFWASFEEMLRVLKPDGMLFLLVPSSGPEHRYPVDCYRFYPDSMLALAKWSKCNLVDVWLDERGPWKDLVGVFSKKEVAKWQIPDVNEFLSPQTNLTASAANPVDVGQFLESEADSVKGAVNYLDLLTALHAICKPQLYLETGVRRGISLQLANCKSIGIDPLPDITIELGNNAQIFRLPSDDFFEFYARNEIGNACIDLAFIDGLHLFEFALRDFINIEKYSNSNTIVIVDDIYPNNAIQAKRIRESKAWAGDVWKMYYCLREYRPDLQLQLMDTFPCGSLLVSGLNPANKVLIDNYNPIVRKFNGSDFETPGEEVFDRSLAVRIDNSSLQEQLSVLLDASLAQQENTQALASSSEIKLSVVVITYKMQRELPRTILSLSPLMQRGIAASEYEVIVIDNGSPDTDYLDQLPFGDTQFSVIRMPKTGSSPCAAVNLGIQKSRGELVAVMVDGARMASPGLLANALKAAQLCPRPIIATIAMHLGTEEQSTSVHQGYNQTVEDEMLAAIDWQANAYQLFDISVFAGSSAGGWFGPLAESSALFMPKNVWLELGGYDEFFVAPGGGLANIDTYSRALALPNTQLIKLLGEGTFHQFHGGVATNALVHPFAQFNEEYFALRGQYYERLPEQHAWYFGALDQTWCLQRTKHN